MERADCLIFSKNRPAQLDLLLRSIDQYACNIYRSVTVLCLATAPEFDHGYVNVRVMIEEPVVTWRYQSFDFEWYFRDWLRSAGKTVSFLCDDDMFYADAPPLEQIRLPWSLRYGDYDYPFSLDGNLYERDQILKLLEGLRFRNPTQLEHQGHLHRDRLPFNELHHGEPCLVGLPWNRVSVDSLMPHAGLHEFDLNERFLNGERLQVALPVAGGPYGTHVIVEPEWTAA